MLGTKLNLLPESTSPFCFNFLKLFMAQNLPNLKESWGVVLCHLQGLNPGSPEWNNDCVGVTHQHESNDHSKHHDEVEVYLRSQR